VVRQSLQHRRVIQSRVIVTGVTEARSAVLAALQEQKAEAICFEDRWWFQGGIRQDTNLADLNLSGFPGEFLNDTLLRCY